MQKIIVGLALVMLIISGCSQTEQQKVRKAVENYNATLINVLSTGQLDLLNDVALDQQVRRVKLFLTTLNEDQRIMNADLLKFDFVETKQRTREGKDGLKTYVYYQVYTEELWEYKYLDAKTMGLVEGPSKMKYKATYDVVPSTDKDKDNWLIHKIEFQQEEVKK